MSRIGNKPIKLENNTSAKVENGYITVSHNGKSLSEKIPAGVNVEIKDNEICFTCENQEANKFQGTLRANIANHVEGLTKSVSKELALSGVGYKAQVSGNKLILSLGYSHNIEMEIPDGIKVTCPSITEIVVSGIEKDKVGQFCANIKAKRPVEPYHGYGIRYKGQRVVRKVGKTAAKGKK